MKDLNIYIPSHGDRIDSLLYAGVIDEDMAIRMKQQRNLSPELERKYKQMTMYLEKEEMLYATQAIADHLTGQLYGCCKVRSNDRSRAAQKAKAVAKRHKKNKNKKTHRK